MASNKLQLAVFWTFCSSLLVGFVGAFTAELCRLDNVEEFTTISDFRSVADRAIESPSAECPSELKRAFEELKRVVHNEDVCSQARVNEIRDFHNTYLVDQKAILPKKVRDLFVAFALKVSLVCRTELTKELIDRSRNEIGPDVWLSVMNYVNKGGILALLINELSGDYDDLIPPKKLVKLVNRVDVQSAKSDKVYLQAYTVNGIRKIQALCEHKLAPLYEPLVFPVATLSHLGYNYKSKPPEEREQKQDDANELVLEWYRLVYMCETLRDIELVQPEEGNANKTYTRVMTQADADELRKSSPQLFEFKDKFVGMKNVDRSERRVDLPDQLYYLTDKQFIKAVRKYKAQRGKVSRFFRKIASVVRDKLSRGVARAVFAKQGILLGSTRVRSADEFVTLLDDYVRASWQAEAQRVKAEWDSRKIVIIPQTYINGIVYTLAAAIILLMAFGLPALILTG